MSFSVQNLAPVGRVSRRPQHSFHVRHRPWQIQPCLLAPVLPGETLKNLLMQARVVSDPVKNPLIGWWYEYYVFYVKHRDMPGSATFQDMVLTYGASMSAVNAAAAKVEHYHSGTTVDWVAQCTETVVEHFFRDQDEASSAASIGNLYAAKVNNSTWLDSVTTDTAMPDGTVIPGGSTPETTDQLMMQYEFMRGMKLTNMTYEDWLQTYGVRTARAEDPTKPELVRYVRDWTYPSNTVDPTSGAPSSALSWSISERADKDRYFAEPGFLYGCCVARPKVYFSKQAGNAAQMLTDAFAWMPAVMRNDPQTSLKKFANTAGPLAGNVTDSYWVDLRDLFIYGDQFINFALSATDAGMVALPTTGMVKKYASSADADALFKSASPANQIRADGVFSLQILGTQVDNT